MGAAKTSQGPNTHLKVRCLPSFPEQSYVPSSGSRQEPKSGWEETGEVMICPERDAKPTRASKAQVCQLPRPFQPQKRQTFHLG